MPEAPPAGSSIRQPTVLWRAARKRRWPRILLWTVGSLVTLLLLAVVAGVLWLRSAALAALPQLDGDVNLSGAGAQGLVLPVTVRRDLHGVPHIDAATVDDMLIAQGYVTAQDRLWQMDSMRRSANGELAEIMGPSLVKYDTAQRVLQIRLTAKRVYDGLPAEDRARLGDYARGVNLYIAQAEQSNSLPMEFRLLMYRPQPWRGVDSLSVGLSMVQELDMHAATKLTRARISAQLNDPRLEADLYPVGSWRDRPPTGIELDLSVPHAEPQPQNDDDEDDDEEEEEDEAGKRALTFDGLEHVGGLAEGDDLVEFAGV